MEKEKKIGLTPLNWILCIVGIIFFTLFIVLPPMFRAFVPEDGDIINNNTGNGTNQPTGTSTPVVSKTTICTKTEIDKEEYRIITENNINQIIAYTNESDYDELDVFNSCEQEALNFINTTGLYNNCEIKENKKIITHRITLEDYNEETSPMPFDIKLSNGEITSYLTSLGFSCSEETNNQ